MLYWWRFGILVGLKKGKLNNRTRKLDEFLRGKRFQVVTTTVTNLLYQSVECPWWFKDWAISRSWSRPRREVLVSEVPRHPRANPPRGCPLASSWSGSSSDGPRCCPQIFSSFLNKILLISILRIQVLVHFTMERMAPILSWTWCFSEELNKKKAVSFIEFRKQNLLLNSAVYSKMWLQHIYRYLVSSIGADFF